jgi:hypothetical protein
MFKQIGFYKEYFLGNKFIGVINYCDKDRETFGYDGKKNEVLAEDILIGKKKIKKGSTVTTLLFPLNGRAV